MKRSGWFAVAIILAVVTVAASNRVGFPSSWLVDPGADGDSTTTSSPSGLERIGADIGLIRGCADAEVVQWAETADVWACSNTFTSPDINGGTWNGTIDAASTATAGLTLNDDILLSYGTGGDVSQYYDGSDFYTNLQAAGSGGWTIGLADGAPAPDNNNVHIWGGSAGATTASSASLLTLENSESINIEFVTPANKRAEIRATSPTGGDVGALQYSHSSAGQPNAWLFFTNNLQRLELSSAGASFKQASSITTTAGNLTLNPTANTNASSDPLLIQSVSQTTTPGTTTDGQIRLWKDTDVGGVDGRIVFQVGGTTYQVNADAGFTFLNNPDILARDIALFTVGFEQWKLDRVQQADDEFVAFDALWPAIGLERLAPTWSMAYLDHLTAQYAIADAYFAANDIEATAPYVPTVAELRAENPWPNPATYTIPDATVNETVGYRNGANMAVGDPLVMVVDRVKFNASEGENWGVHAVPSTLTDEFIWLLQNDAAFLASVKTLLGLLP